MVFNSWTFLVFFLLVLILHNFSLDWTKKKANLLIASYIFYAAWNPPFVVILWVTTLVDWFVAKHLFRAMQPRRRQLLLMVSLIGNLGLLGYFKYGSFLLDNFVLLAAELGINYRPAAANIVLPIGISFYTFVTLSYTIDVYRKEITPAKSFLDFALLVTFFPHLVAGPILRANKFLSQCELPCRANGKQLGWGVALIIIGLFEKVFLADGLLAPVADQVYTSVLDAGKLDAWSGTLAFSGQIFLDFDGYSLCAIGAAMCLGFVFPDNFRFPYAAVGFSDFWQRWHISLSSWLRDYLYIPLGGNRKGGFRTYTNLMLTMLIGGLWHGASWRFVAWGGLHGCYLIIERLIHSVFSIFSVGSSVKGPFFGEGLLKSGVSAGYQFGYVFTAVGKFALGLLTYLLVCLTWVFFRAQSFSDALAIFRAMFAGGSGHLNLGYYAIGSVFLITIGLLLFHWLLKDSSLEEFIYRMPNWMRVVLLITLLCGIAIAPGDERAFIYFQF
ncbi:MAG: MBOAT family protein [Acidobacteria bacterium]|nr:MBOAT family protein [Acidobacteriota bacterium]